MAKKLEEDRELLMQKHNNTHKTLCGLWVSWIIVPVAIAIRFHEFASFLNTDTTTIVGMALVLLITYLAITWTFYYKCNEYEHLIKHHCPICSRST